MSTFNLRSTLLSFPTPVGDTGKKEGGGGGVDVSSPLTTFQSVVEIPRYDIQMNTLNSTFLYQGSLSRCRLCSLASCL